MAELATIARPYASAVFDLAKDSGELDRWSRMLAFAATAASDDTLADYLDSPVPAKAKVEALIAVCGDELNDVGQRFISVLAQNKRLDLLVEILAQFEEFKAMAEQILDVEVVSAQPLTEAQQASLTASLKARFDREVAMVTSVDESLLGGAIIRAGDTVIDGSVKGKIGKLAEGVLR